MMVVRLKKKTMMFSERKKMYIVKVQGKKLTLKTFKDGFKSYELARNAVRKYLRNLGLGRNLSTNSVAIVRV
jgi:hypothetical protein